MSETLPTIVIEGEIVESVSPGVVGLAANRAASEHVFDDYRQRKAASTLRAQQGALTLFSEFLCNAGVLPLDATLSDKDKRKEYRKAALALVTEPGAWQPITWGLVKGFVQWQLGQGYAVTTINTRLSHIKVYARLANQAEMLAPGEYERIVSVAGFGGQERARVDEKRVTTRIGKKKDTPAIITSEQAKELMTEQPDTPQGRRDALICHLALKHGLRVSELAILRVSDIIITRNKQGKAVTGVISFFRPKLAGTDHERGEHTLMNGTLKLIASYLEKDAPAIGTLLVGSRKGGKLTGQAMTTRSISVRVKSLGEKVGLSGLSAHDCRHYAATKDGLDGKSIRYMMEKYGWTSAQTAMRYTHQHGPVVVE